MKGGLTKDNNGENGDQRRERGRRTLLDEKSVIEEKIKTLRGEVRAKGRR